MVNTILQIAILAFFQHQPFPVHDAKPVILNGPYLLAPAEDSVTVVWTTDTPSHSRVLYGTGGKLDKVAEPQQHGLIPIGTKHAVKLEGLQPGTTYQYKAVSTRVVRMKSYWPEKGLDAESPVRSFTTFDRRKRGIAFAVMTDTHADMARIAALLKLIDWEKTDFLVHLGDAFDTENEEVIWSRWLDPLSAALGGAKPLLYARGNHETRGAAARVLMDSVPISEGRFYYARDHGPAHLVVLDTGEDKPDDTNVYARLNAFGRYKEQEYAWFENHLRSDAAAKSAAFRILLMHAPNWGWTADQSAKWSRAANEGRIDLSISGHTHRFADIKPGEKDNGWRQLVIAPDQLARVEVTEREISVTVLNSKDGSAAASFTVPARSR